MSLADQRQATLRLIESEPTMVELFRSAWEPDGAGGRRRADPAAPQGPVPRFLSGIDADKSVAFNQLGLRKERVFVLIGPYDDDIQENDVFTIDGKVYRVVWVDDDRRYQCKAECIHGS